MRQTMALCRLSRNAQSGIDRAMKICRDLPSLRAACAVLRASGRRLGLVPTMGALHDGHVSLLAAARAAGADAVAASIFVNPLQFNANDDLARYPRDEDGDLAKLSAAGAIWCGCRRLKPCIRLAAPA